MDAIWTRQYAPGVPTSLAYPDSTLPDLLTQSARRFPENAAIRFYGKVIGYGELNRLATRFARVLGSLGLREGGVVGLMLPNLPQTIVAYYGGMRAGAVVTPINPLYVEGEIAQQVEDSGCEVLLALDSFYPRLKPLVGRTCLKRVILTGVEDYLPVWKRIGYRIQSFRKGQRRVVPQEPSSFKLHDLMAGASDAEFPSPAKPDSLALLQYTGGTTGVPKGVELTQRNLFSNTLQCRQWMPSLRDGEEVFLGVLPFFHVYGMSVCQNLAVMAGAALVLLPRFQIGEVLQTIARESITVFPGIPAMYQAINNSQQVGRYDLRSVRICISGAGPLPASVQERFEAVTGARLVEGYGLTEASPVTHVNPIPTTPQMAAVRRSGSIGVPLPDTEAKVMDMETGEREVPLGEIGELAVRGPQIMRGYWRHEQETRQVLRDGWLYTGDLVRMDADGFFYIADRKKDMIKSGGENVYPREIEEVLLLHPKVRDAVVVGIPLGLRGELIKAYVVLKEREEASPAELLEHCRGHLARFKVPKKVEFRAELPKTLVGKVLRRQLIAEEVKKGVPQPDRVED